MVDKVSYRYRPIVLLLILALSSCLISANNHVSRNAVIPFHKTTDLRNSSSSNSTNSISNALICGLKNAVASGLGTAVSKTLLAPFDTLKTVQQQEKGEYLSFLQAYHRVTSRSNNGIKGILDLYAGLGVAVIGAMPSVGLYFGVYAYCKRTITPALQERFENNSNMKTVGIAISAAIGNTVASFSRVPYEVVKQKLQAGIYPNTMLALQSMWADAGMRAFFPLGGISSQMVRDIPYAIFTLMSYEILREQWVQRVQIEKNNGKPSTWRNMLAGGIAGGIGSFLTNPMDVVKTRLQTDVGMYAGVIDCFKSTYAKEGAPAFLKGVGPRLMHKVPANAFFFVSFELFRRLLNVDQEVAPTISNDKAQVGLQKSEPRKR